MPIIHSKTLQEPFNIALIISKFNEEITQRLYQGALARLVELQVPEERITVVWVPGAVEIPLVAQRLAKLHNYAALITLGAVIRGETTHYDYVCQQVSAGCQQVALQYDLPVIFGVLTTENEDQALARTGGKHGHKGHDAVDAAFEMISVLQQVDVL